MLDQHDEQKFDKTLACIFIHVQYKELSVILGKNSQCIDIRANKIVFHPYSDKDNIQIKSFPRLTKNKSASNIPPFVCVFRLKQCDSSAKLLYCCVSRVLLCQLLRNGALQAILFASARWFRMRVRSRDWWEDSGGGCRENFTMSRRSLKKCVMMLGNHTSP